MQRQINAKWTRRGELSVENLSHETSSEKTLSIFDIFDLDFVATIQVHSANSWKKCSLEIVDRLQSLDEHSARKIEIDRGNSSNAAQFEFAVSSTK